MYEWKRSQDWYESLGWQTLRWNSNVHREASLTITVGAPREAPADGEGVTVGPRGSLPPTSAPVLQLHYAYGCKPIKQPTDEAAPRVVVAAAEGAEPAELTDPDAYQVLLRPE